MYNELLHERYLLQVGCCDRLFRYVRETDKEKASELLADLLAFEKRIESINCKLVHMQFIEMSKRKN